MRRVIFTAVALVLGVASFAKDTTAEFKLAMAKEKVAVEAAFGKKDIGWFEKNCTADFSYVSGKEKTDRKGALAGMKQLFSMCKTLKADMKLVSARATDGNGIAVVEQTLNGKMIYPNDKKVHTMKSVSTIRMTMVKKGSSWIMKKLEDVKPPTMLIDGKPYDPYASQAAAPKK